VKERRRRRGTSCGKVKRENSTIIGMPWSNARMSEREGEREREREGGRERERGGERYAHAYNNECQCARYFKRRAAALVYEALSY
jgi:hypothetical protein